MSERWQGRGPRQFRNFGSLRALRWGPSPDGQSAELVPLGVRFEASFEEKGKGVFGKDERVFEQLPGGRGGKTAFVVPIGAIRRRMIVTTRGAMR